MTTLRRMMVGALAGVALHALAGAQVVLAQQDSTDPIRLAVNDWTGAHVTTNIAGKVLSEVGYNVEFVSAGYLAQFTALADGEISVSMEIWSSSVGEHWTKAEKAGTVVDLGPLGLSPAEGWMYPKHMETICPGLPNWEALKEPKCVEELATAESFPKGRILDYPADWGSATKTVVEDFKLPYVVQPGGSEGALVAEFNASVAKKSPLVLMFWSPHWVTSDHEIGWVEFPDGESGPVFPTNRVFKVAWVKAKEKWPRAMRLIGKIQLTNKEYAGMIKAVDVDGEKLEDVIAAWVTDNKDRWQKWWDASAN